MNDKTPAAPAATPVPEVDDLRRRIEAIPDGEGERDVAGLKRLALSQLEQLRVRIVQAEKLAL